MGTDSSHERSTITIQQAFVLAMQHHQAGRLAEAEPIYRQILAQQPEHADALHLLGVIAHQVGRIDDAVELISKAIQFKPDYAEAYSNLGYALKDQGQLDEAIAAYRRAIQLKPDYAEAHSNLGNALKDQDQIDQAIAAYRRAIQLKPDYAEAHSNLGNALKDQDQLDQAIVAYRIAIQLSPDLAEAHYNLGVALKDQGQLEPAIAAYRSAIQLKPDLAEAHSNLGNALKDQGQLDQAIAALRSAIQLKPDLAVAHSNLGNALQDQGHLDQAIAAYRRAIQLKPEYAEAYSNLGNALQDQGQLDQAISAFRSAIQLKPGLAEAHSNLGNALQDQGQLDQAIAAYRRAIQLEPHSAEVHSNLVYTLYFHSGDDTQTIYQEHQRWNQQHAEPLQHLIRPHTNDRSPGRRLRIGYVSPDFRSHVVGRNMLPLFANHHRDEFEIFCYAQVVRRDALTSRFRDLAHHWRNLVGLSDEQAAELIRQDQIDILVDLTLHMEGNRLLVFARKPAPVQVSFAGYPGTTGLKTIDYRLSDHFLDPLGRPDTFYSEQTVRLPDTFWCYDPVDCLDLSVNPLPAQSNGCITFGCLNNFCKINDGVLQLWAKVLHGVPESRILLLAPEGVARETVSQVLEREGIARQRIEFVPHLPRRNYLELYQRIDIGLDTFPYNGHTTSLDSFWMGVPVVTLVGQTIVGRAGSSQLMNLGLPELVAHSAEAYVQIAVKLAHDPPRLTELRSTLRPRMEASPLMDAPRFAGAIEAAYRQMWQTWCARA